jgi:hypothetical protein
MDKQCIAQILRELRPGTGERVLVAVMNNPRDLAIACEQHWYRIPVTRAPKQIGADYLAFYLTGAFSPEQRHRISLYAPIYAYHLARRIELLPEEPAHPRARERYYKIEIGSLCSLARPIPSQRLRRVTFIPTTLDRLLNAREIKDLWDRERQQAELWAALMTEESE